MVTLPPEAKYLVTPPLCQKGLIHKDGFLKVQICCILVVVSSYMYTWLRTPKKDTLVACMAKMNKQLQLQVQENKHNYHFERHPQGWTCKSRGSPLRRPSRLHCSIQRHLNGSRAFLAPKRATCQSWCCLTTTLSLLGQKPQLLGSISLSSPRPHVALCHHLHSKICSPPPQALIHGNKMLQKVSNKWGLPM